MSIGLALVELGRPSTFGEIAGAGWVRRYSSRELLDMLERLTDDGVLRSWIVASDDDPASDWERVFGLAHWPAPDQAHLTLPARKARE